MPGNGVPHLAAAAIANGGGTKVTFFKAAICLAIALECLIAVQQFCSSNIVSYSHYEAIQNSPAAVSQQPHDRRLLRERDGEVLGGKSSGLEAELDRALEDAADCRAALADVSEAVKKVPTTRRLRLSNDRSMEATADRALQLYTKGMREAREAFVGRAADTSQKTIADLQAQLADRDTELEVLQRERHAAEVRLREEFDGEAERLVGDKEQEVALRLSADFAAKLDACREERNAAMRQLEEEVKARAQTDADDALAQAQAEVSRLLAEHADLKLAFDRLVREKQALDDMMSKSGREFTLPADALKAARSALLSCGGRAAPSKTAGVAITVNNANLTSWKAYGCEATDTEIAQYLDYTPRGPCPNDWFFVQELIYVKNCFALPKRRCIAVTPRDHAEVLPFPRSLFSQDALDDRNVNWDLHWCKSFECLNTRALGDCRNCFNMSLEANRWRSNYRGSLKMREVIDMKRGTLRIGLDAGGGTGSFAAHMARFNVTILTTAMNVETVWNRYMGLPYMETIALRGLVPLHVPHKARLPFFDNTLDIVHSVNSVKYLPMLDFEELIFEWDRVLRPGGIMWFEMFYAPVDEMPLYISVLELLGYRRLHWNLTPKPDAGERGGAHVYLNAVIEKPARSYR